MASVSELNTDAVELQQRIERFHAVREGILKQVRQVIVGQQDVLEQMLIALFVGGHCLVTGMPGTAKTLMVRTHGRRAGPALPPHPVHARPDAVRHHGHRHHRRRPDHRPSQVDICRRADLRQHHPGRRNQPHAAQDAGRAARSHAGTFVHRARPRLFACRSRSLYWPRRTRSNSKARIRCPRRSWTAFCSMPSSDT